MPRPVSSSSVSSAAYSAPAEAQAAGASDAGESADASCAEELVDVARAGAALAGSVAALVAATPTLFGVLPGIASFVGSSLYLGKAAAELANCHDQAAAKAE